MATIYTPRAHVSDGEDYDNLVARVDSAVHRPLSRVPENLMKLVVGVLLTTFGAYFSVLGLRDHWPHGDTAVWFVLLFAALSYGLIKWLKTTALRNKGVV